VLELLEHTRDDIVCLVRPGEQDVQERLWQALDKAVAAYQTPAAVAASIRSRVTALAGDVELPMCGVNLAELPRRNYRSFWHSAASLRFEDRHADQIMRSNIDGTRHALALATEMGIFDFNSMSTAYVAGNLTGDIPELRNAAVVSNNLYEKSKVAAEGLILEASHFALRVFRPSIVIGHSRTYGATNFTGMYGMLRQLFNFQGVMARTQENLLQTERLRLRADVGIPVDLVPVDRVVANAVKVYLATRADIRPGEATVYHLNNPTPPTIDALLNVLFRKAGIALPIYLTRDDQLGEMQWLDEQFNNRIEFYRTYFRNHKQFQRQQLERWIGAEDLSAYHMPDEVLERYCDWYLNILVAERAAMPTSR
jgi:nucleoside-diphosphate-sugar epimerase